jgi:hypothetical protein
VGADREALKIGGPRRDQGSVEILGRLLGGDARSDASLAPRTGGRTASTDGIATSAREGVTRRAITTTPGSAPRPDRVEISPEARRLLDADRGSEADEKKAGLGGAEELTEDERQQVDELQARDREVRQHEQAHLAAAGDLASGGPSYTYQTGPDGKRYAVGGEVQIRLAEGRTAEETLDNARRAKRAALAPAEPSPQDRNVAARADALALSAQREIAEERRAGGDESTSDAAGRVGATATTESDAAASPVDGPAVRQAATAASPLAAIARAAYANTIRSAPNSAKIEAAPTRFGSAESPSGGRPRIDVSA